MFGVSAEQNARRIAEEALLGAKLHQSYKNSMKRTDVWSDNIYVFKMQGAGYHAESHPPNALNPLKMGKSFCHEPLQTTRTLKPFL